jgi:hypothetical protein
MKRLAAVGLVLLLLGALVQPGQADVAADVEARLLQDLAFLTSDACEGRGITTKGIHLAAEHIAREFQKAGLKPGAPDGTYFQSFPLTTAAKAGPNNRLAFRGPQGQTITLEYEKHFTAALQGGTGKADAPLVFAGYGITSAEPSYDDYAGLDVAGKVVVVLTGTPRRGQRYADVFAAAADNRTSPHASLGTKLANALTRKAAAVLVVSDPSTTRFAGSSRPSYSLRSGNPVALPAVNLPRDWLDRLLTATVGRGLADVEKDIDATLRPHSTPLTGWTCQLETDVSHTQITVKNVLGVAGGTGALAEQTVVIGAHYDHVGMGSSNRIGSFRTGVSGPGAPGGVGFPLAEMAVTAVHHGADDNASGSTALMELARRFGSASSGTAAVGRSPAGDARRLVLIAFTAEESGLLGSAYYCRHPVFPLRDTVAMINMDMVGRLQDNRLLIGGLGSAKHFPALIDKLNEQHRFDLLQEPSGMGPSDHASFYAQQIPVFKFFTGFHEQYHRPSDRLETLNVPGLRRVVDLVADVAADLRTNPTRPEYVKTGGFDRTKTLWSQAPATGVLPDYADRKGGALIAGVIANTPAARAGLKKGDRILALAGKPVKDPAEFHGLARRLKPGDKIAATLERDGQAQQVELQLVRAPAGSPDRRFGFVADTTDLKDGLLLTEVPADSPAGRAGLQKGDRILTIAAQEIKDVQTYGDVVRAVQPGELVPITAVRGGQTLQFQVPAAESARPSRRGTPRPR